MRITKEIATIDKALFLIAVLLMAVTFYLDYISGNAGTKDWLLLAARKWLGGETLYVNIFEVNPPLIVWLYALPVLVSLHTPLVDFHALVLLGGCIAAFSLWLCIRLMRFYPPFANDGRKRLHFGLLLTLVLVAFVNPVYFADREHIFFMLTLPYMLRNMPGLACATLPLPLKIAVGALAGIGFCIKPYCSIIFAGIQLLVIARQRTFRILFCIENAIVYAVGLGYLCGVVFLAPHYLRDVLPVALATYPAYRGKPDVFVVFGVFFTFAMTFIEFRPGHVSAYRKDIWYFLGLIALCLFYALINNGWTYAYLPLESIILVATGFVFWEFKALAREAQEKGETGRSFRFGALGCVLNLAANSGMVLLVFFAALMAGYSNDAATRGASLQGMVAATKARSFGTLTMDFIPWAHLVRATGAQWQTRFNHLWMLPEFMESDAGFTRDHLWILKAVAGDLAIDLDTKKPDVVFVNVSPVVCATCKPAEILPFFLPYADFAQAWSRYRFFRQVDVCPASAKALAAHPDLPKPSSAQACRYDVYQRLP